PYVSCNYNVRITNHTMLSILYTYPTDYMLEYPTTTNSSEQRIGHLILVQDPTVWNNYPSGLAYSVGGPGGMKETSISVLTDETGKPVPCIKEMRTCMWLFLPEELLTF